MGYSVDAMERAMKVQEVIMRALSGQLTWLQAADILGRSPRSIRRLRWKVERYGLDDLIDHRRRTPSPKRAPVAEVARLPALYRDRYQGFNVRHFHQLARRQHGVRFCYAFVKKALQSAGLVAKHRPRGRHRLAPTARNRRSNLEEKNWRRPRRCTARHDPERLLRRRNGRG